MPVIKRYPNRKLYDTEAKQYITLDTIAEMIRTGQEIQVVDNATGEDLTAITLSQIVFEQEKKQSGFLPRSVLAGLIQAGGESIQALGRSLSSTVGISNHIFEDELQRRIEVLTRKGEVTMELAEAWKSKLLSTDLLKQPEESPARQGRKPRTQELEQYIAAQQIPTRKDLDDLMTQIEALAEKLEELEQDAST